MRGHHHQRTWFQKRQKTEQQGIHFQHFSAINSLCFLEATLIPSTTLALPTKLQLTNEMRQYIAQAPAATKDLLDTLVHLHFHWNPNGDCCLARRSQWTKICWFYVSWSWRRARVRWSTLRNSPALHSLPLLLGTLSDKLIHRIIGKNKAHN